MIRLAGKKSKYRRTIAKIEDWMCSKDFGWHPCILALGDGLVGDLAGFIVATYMRGIPFI